MIEPLNIEPHPPCINRTCAYHENWYFTQLGSDSQCRNNLRVGSIQGNTVVVIILDCTHV